MNAKTRFESLLKPIDPELSVWLDARANEKVQYKVFADYLKRQKNHSRKKRSIQMTGKKTKRKIILIVSVIIVVLITVAVSILLKMSGELKQMNALQTGEFLPGIHAINCDFVNMFLMDCGGSYIAVDAGGDRRAVEQGLSQIGISSDSVAYVLMTHTHGDHTAGLDLFNNAVVYGVNESVAAHAVSDGDTLTLNGRSIQVIGTPGHADDSVCYLIDGQYLFAGDNLSLKDGKVGLFNSVYNNSDEQQKSDIAKLAKLDSIRYIITAHYGYAENPIFP